MRALKWLLVLLIALHGLIHLMGTFGAWGNTSVQAQIGTPSMPLSGDALAVLGFVWLAACAALIASAVLLAFHRAVWVPVALAGIALSQVAIVFWWMSAWRGTLANLLILAAIAWQVTRHARVPLSNAAHL
jgi:hypothetical protein